MNATVQRSYGEFSLALSQRAARDNRPLHGTIEVTHRCPLGCSHCYNNLPMSDAGARRTELSLDEHKRILDELADAGCLWLLLSGGEIFARADFLDIYEHAKRRGFFVTLFTNGILVNERIADRLQALPPFAIEITLYGRTRETYERLTSVPGSYDRCLRGIALLRERGLPLKLKTVAVSVNKHELRDMQRFAEEELGVEFKFDGMINPRTDCSASPLAVRLSPEELVELDLADDKRLAGWREFGAHGIGPSHPPDRAGEVYSCGGGVTSFAIDPYGKLSICVLSQREGFDLRGGAFLDGWRQFLAGVRRRKARRVTRCTACQLKAMCGMCPANGELEAGDPEEPVDFLCRVAHLRAITMGFPIPAHGECAYCAGGAGHEELAAAAARLSRGEPAPVVRRLPLVAPSAIGGACGSDGGGCGACAP